MRLLLSAEAEADLSAIADHIAAASPAAALRLVNVLRLKFELLAEVPGIGRARTELGADLRSFPVGPYLIFYRVQPDVVEIARILHGARDLGQALK